MTKNRLFLALSLTLMVFLTILLFRAYINSPNNSLVNGVYNNTCCEFIVLADGKISHGNDISTYRLVNMKFGLTGYVNGTIYPDGIRKSSENSALLFHKKNGVWVFSAIIDGVEYEFLEGARYNTHYGL